MPHNPSVFHPHQAVAAVHPSGSRPVACVCWLVLFTAGLSMLGCDQSDPHAQQPSGEQGQAVLASSTQSPRKTLEACIRAYQQLSSYQDSAYVNLSYRVDNEPVVDRAPLAVAWDSSGRIALRVYSVVAGPSDGRWHLRMTEAGGPTGKAYQHQVLSREIPKQLDYDWLLSEPVVADALAAGLAGFPPQLDLLLSQQPMVGLIDDESQLSFDAQDTIDGRACQVVSINRHGLRYRLWIDQGTLMLRRVQIPKENLGAEILQDRRVSELQLTIELEGVRPNSPIDWQQFSLPARSEDRLVSHFVPPPPPIDTAGLGVRFPAFTLNSPVNEEVYSSAEASQRKATVLVWLADHPACRAAAEQLAYTSERLAAAGIAPELVEFVTVWAEPQPPAGSSFDSLQSDWKLPGVLALDSAALGRDLFGIQEAPTLIVLDGQNRLQLREARSNPILDQLLPGLLRQLASDVDLATEVIARQQAAATRFAAEVAMATAIDGRRQPLPEQYPPATFKLTEVSSKAWNHTSIAARVDQHQLLWILQDNGQLECFDVERGTTQRFTTTWHQPLEGPTGLELARQLWISPQADYVASSAIGSTRVQILNTQSLHHSEFELENNARSVDMHWLQVEGTKSPRLAVITNNSQTLLLDPNNREQLSGRCPAAPVALLADSVGAAGAGGWVVLANRAIEPLELSTESTVNRGLARPASHAPTSHASIPDKLSFMPAAGPWQSWEDEKSRQVLARGWLAGDEPALFLLNHSLQPVWHYPMPLISDRRPVSVSAAKDPATGQPVWAINGPNRTIHVLRGDGRANDHFRLAEPVVGVALVPAGTRLLLVVVHPRQTVAYQLEWNL